MLDWSKERFRGKADNGAWTYGWLVAFDGRTFIVPQGAASFGQAVPVNPNTIEKFTGYCDINDVEIYEGDILGGFVDHTYAEVILYTHDRFKALNTRRGRNIIDIGPQTGKNFYIAGNVHDSADLLKVAPPGYVDIDGRLYEVGEMPVRKTWEQRNFLD